MLLLDLVLSRTEKVVLNVPPVFVVCLYVRLELRVSLTVVPPAEVSKTLVLTLLLDPVEKDADNDGS